MAAKGIAATAASVLLFSTLVLADSVLVVSQGNSLAAAQLQATERRESLVAQLSMGAASLDVLAQVQRYLSENSARCDSIGAYLDAISAAAALRVDEMRIRGSVTAHAARTYSPAPLPENMTMLVPFTGFAPGELNLAVRLNVDEGSAGGDVLLRRSEVHVLHVPILAESAESLCAYAIDALGRAFQGNCNYTADATSFSSAYSGLMLTAAARGFDLKAGWDAEECSATYWITLDEHGVAGPVGEFDWSIRGSGEAAA